MDDLPTRTIFALARALDVDDFAEAARHLADDCVYDTGRETLAGPEAILRSYERSSAWAREHFEVRYQSALEPASGAEVPVRYTDVLTRGDRRHTYRCRQVYTVGPAGLVVRIVHQELPGERETLETFLRECGL